ncbi:hypothetical protein ACFLX4_00300 [Chloroflexota bacterium]
MVTKEIQAVKGVSVKRRKDLIQALNNENLQIRWKAAATLRMIGWQPINDEQKVHYFLAACSYQKLAQMGKVGVEALLLMGTRQ